MMGDESHRDVGLMTMTGGLVYPMSTMPGEPVGHVYAGPMARETDHFAAAVPLDQPVLVTPEEARQVVEVYIAADLSAGRNEPVELPARAGANRLPPVPDRPPEGSRPAPQPAPSQAPADQ